MAGGFTGAGVAFNLKGRSLRLPTRERLNMAKSDEIYALARAALYNDKLRASATVQCIIASEPARSTLKHRLVGLSEKSPIHGTVQRHQS